MATHTHYTLTTVKKIFEIPAEGPYGAAAAEVVKAWTAAEREYRQAHGLADDAVLHDNAITFHPTNTSIQIVFTQEETRA